MSDDLHCHGCGYPVHTSIANACPWCRSNAKEITRLRAENGRLEAKLAKAVAILRDAERLCAEGHPVSALNLALAILAELKGKGDE